MTDDRPTMTAQAIDRFGGTDVFGTETIPRPAVEPGSVLVRVEATSVNPVDTMIRRGDAGPFAPELPAVLHGDVAGIVEEVGTDVTEFAPGDEVYACAGGVAGTGGALAEFMLADADLVARKPESLSMAEAAALPLVTITAWDGLIDRVNVGTEDTVLVHGATGGVGHVAIQLAKHAGATVYTTASSEAKLETGKELGADTGINYQNQSVEEYVDEHTDGRGFDVVFDTVGGENIDRSLEATALNGDVVTTTSSSSHDLSPMHGKGLSLHVVFMLIPMLYGVGRAHHGDILTETTELVDSNELSPLLDEESYRFDEMGAAHNRVESGEQIGKVTLTQ